MCFDLSKGKGSEWNDRVFRLLALECMNVHRSRAPAGANEDFRVRTPQFYELLRNRFNTAWKKLSQIRFRNDETEEERRERVRLTVLARERSKRKSASRREKYKNRMRAIQERSKRGASLKAMKVAEHILSELGVDGMSSEDEATDPVTGVVSGYKVSELVWRDEEMTRLLHKLDDIWKQLKNNKGAKRLPRFRGEISSRHAVQHLTYQFYARAWLNEAISNGVDVLRSGHTTGWTNFTVWNASLQPTFR